MKEVKEVNKNAMENKIKRESDCDECIKSKLMKKMRNGLKMITIEVNKSVTKKEIKRERDNVECLKNELMEEMRKGLNKMTTECDKFVNKRLKYLKHFDRRDRVNSEWNSLKENHKNEMGRKLEEQLFLKAKVMPTNENMNKINKSNNNTYKSSDEEEKNEIVYAMGNNPSNVGVIKDYIWVLDSGASCHMTHVRK